MHHEGGKFLRRLLGSTVTNLRLRRSVLAVSSLSLDSSSSLIAVRLAHRCIAVHYRGRNCATPKHKDSSIADAPRNRNSLSLSRSVGNLVSAYDTTPILSVEDLASD